MKQEAGCYLFPVLKWCSRLFLCSMVRSVIRVPCDSCQSCIGERQAKHQSQKGSLFFKEMNLLWDCLHGYSRQLMASFRAAWPAPLIPTGLRRVSVRDYFEHGLNHYANFLRVHWEDGSSNTGFHIWGQLLLFWSPLQNWTLASSLPFRNEWGISTGLIPAEPTTYWWTGVCRLLWF